MALPKGVDLLPSGKFRARFMHAGRKYTEVWDTARQAEDWIRRTRNDLALGVHADSEVTDPATGRQAAPLFKVYAADWVQHRRVRGRPLKHGTRLLYGKLLAEHILPAFGGRRVDAITPRMVADWHKALLPDAPTRRAHAYALLRTILGTAVEEDLIAANPARVKGAGAAERASVTEVPTAAQVQALAEAMPGPKYRTAVLMLAWCGLRFGELVELRRKDLVLDAEGVPTAIRVRRGYYRGVVDTPKSGAGVRDVVIPPHIRAEVGAWLDSRPKGRDALLFPGTRGGERMPETTLRKHLHEHRSAAGCPTLRIHDLRHFAGTTASLSGASLKEVMGRLGHSTVNAAMRYQHAAQNRDAEIAEAMSALAGAKVGNVVPIRPGKPEVQEQQQEVKPVQSKPEQYWSLTEVRRMLRLSNAGQLRELIRRGEIATTVVRGREMVAESALVAFERMRQAEEQHLLGG